MTSLALSRPTRRMISGQHTATVHTHGYPMECWFTFDPGEPPILFPIDRAHPGTAPKCELEICLVNGQDIFEEMSDSARKAVEEALVREMEEA